MPTGDGLLARLHPPLGILTLTQLRAIAEAARRFGNGHVDVTGRGNLQIRGVTAETTCGLATFLTEAGLGDTRTDGGPQRITLTSPLAGLAAEEPDDVSTLARAIETGAGEIAGLPAKTLVAIEGLGVPCAEADIIVRLGSAYVRIGLAGAPDVSLDVPKASAPNAVAAMLRSFAALKRRRVRELSALERDQVLDAARANGTALVRPAASEQGLDADPSPRGVVGGGDAATSSRLRPGLSMLGAHTFLTVEAPFGRCGAAELDGLAAMAGSVGTAEIRTTPSRGFVLAVASRKGAQTALSALTNAGFITDPDDPRRAVAACPGAPACASGTTPVPAQAAQLAEAFAPFAARGLAAHVSGCTKGCAHPGPADLTLVAEGGRYRIAWGGAAGDALGSRLTFEAALERVRRADPTATTAGACPSESAAERQTEPVR